MSVMTLCVGSVKHSHLEGVPATKDDEWFGDREHSTVVQYATTSHQAAPLATTDNKPQPAHYSR